MNKSGFIKETSDLHRKHYGKDPQVISFAPGRAEVLGNHTDYNLGTVLSTAIDRGICFCISENSGEGLRAFAGNMDKAVSFTLDTIGPVKEASWASYIKGVFYFLKEHNLEIKDWDCTFMGNIPIGSGLSSSAALEVSAAYAAQEMTKIWIDKVETAKLCRESESRFAGCNCGLLDQFSSIYGKEHSLIHTDFRTLEVTPVSIPEEIQFLIITPEVTHSLSESPYNERRQSCEESVDNFAKLISHPVESLRDISPEEFEKYKNEIPEEASKRAAHIVGEIDRVARGIDALKNNDIPLFGELMYQSHESSRVLFENSAIELDQVVEAAKEEGALGARLSGGGWGGSLIALIKEGQAENLSAGINARCKDKGLELKFQVILPSEGAQIIKERS